MRWRNPFSNRNRHVRCHLQGGLAAGVEQPGVTIEGTLAGETRRCLVIWAPKVLDSTPEKGAEPVEVSGHVEIPRERLLFMQILG